MDYADLAPFAMRGQMVRNLRHGDFSEVEYIASVLQQENSFPINSPMSTWK